VAQTPGPTSSPRFFRTAQNGSRQSLAHCPRQDLRVKGRLGLLGLRAARSRTSAIPQHSFLCSVERRRGAKSSPQDQRLSRCDTRGCSVLAVQHARANLQRVRGERSAQHELVRGHLGGRSGSLRALPAEWKLKVVAGPFISIDGERYQAPKLGVATSTGTVGGYLKRSYRRGRHQVHGGQRQDQREPRRQRAGIPVWMAPSWKTGGASIEGSNTGGVH